jgi:hypothetical protein
MKGISTNKRLSLSPLSFNEAVTDILKIKPEPKALKKRPPKANREPRLKQK